MKVERGYHVTGKNIVYIEAGKRWPVFRDGEGFYRLEYVWDHDNLRHASMEPVPLAPPEKALALSPTWRDRQGWNLTAYAA